METMNKTENLNEKIIPSKADITTSIETKSESILGSKQEGSPLLL